MMRYIVTFRIGAIQPAGYALVCAKYSVRLEFVSVVVVGACIVVGNVRREVAPIVLQVIGFSFFCIMVGSVLVCAVMVIAVREPIRTIRAALQETKLTEEQNTLLRTSARVMLLNRACAVAATSTSVLANILYTIHAGTLREYEEGTYWYVYSPVSPILWFFVLFNKLCNDGGLFLLAFSSMAMVRDERNL